MNQLEKIAVISDVHGNLPALQAVLEDIEGQDCSEIFFLGDLVNGVDPSSCIQIMHRLQNISCLKGNAESYVLTPDLENFSRKDDPLYNGLIPLLQWYQSRLSEEALAWVDHWPDWIIRERMCFVHDSPLDRISLQSSHPIVDGNPYHELELHSKGITVDMPAADWLSLTNWMDFHAVSQVLCGHTHKPFYKKLGEKHICNVGSIGMPLDGDPRSSWVLVESQPEREITIHIRRVTYDIEKFLQIIDSVEDYPSFKTPTRREAYKRTLTTGRFQM